MHDTDAMPARVARFLSAHDGRRSATVVRYEAMVGGYSRLMARADVEWSDGVLESVVLRGDPPPGRSMIETDRDAEHALLTALSGSIRMPNVRHYDSTGDHLGTKCIVLDHVDGSSLQALLNDAPADALGSHMRELVDVLATIHSVDADHVGLPLDRPTDWTSYLGSLIDRFRQADAAAVESVPFLRYVAAWLDAHRPPPLPLRLVHSDFQPSNIMVSRSGDLLMIDWELAHIGDPREDLGYYNVYASAVGPNLFLADPEAFLARYRERTGFSEEAVNMDTMAYFSSMAAITVYAQVLAGASALARGTNSGLMTTYAMNALTVGHGNFLAGCRVAEPGRA
jgi:aminoglycoside phosphotransferase (APT) family kinase protein